MNQSLLFIITITIAILTLVTVLGKHNNAVFSQLQQQQQPLSTDLTDQQIAEQIKQLQNLLAKKHAAPERTDLLAISGNLKFPIIGTKQYDALKNCNPNQTQPVINSTEFQNRYRTYLTDFKCGHVTKIFANNNTALREFTLIANDNFGYGHYVNVTRNITDPSVFPAWLFNNSLPAPTLRMTQGDHIKITVINSNESKFPHSFHMHSIHSGMADGMTGAGGSIPPNGNFTYEYIARPYGVYPYHCHMQPVQYHIMRGLYGLMIIDPPQPRPPAKEMVMLMNGYSYNQIDLVHPNNTAPPSFTNPTAQDLREATDQQAKDAWKSDDKRSTSTNTDRASSNGTDDQANAANGEDTARDARIAQTLSPGPQADNQIYTVNGKAFGYTANDAIHLVTNRNYRIYLANLLEFDQVNSFHMHGNMFDYFPSGTSLQPAYLTDIVTLGQGDRGILQFKFLVVGDYMIHSHINRFSELGWMGFLHVTKN